jgi:hypothetical protein
MLHFACRTLLIFHENQSGYATLRGQELFLAAKVVYSGSHLGSGRM